MDDDGGSSPSRGALLARYDVLDTPREAEFDDIARLAAAICGTPIGVVNFVDEEGARFAPDMLGSLVFVGGLPLEEALDTVGIDGAAPVGTPILMPDGREAGTLYTQSGGRAIAHMRFDRMGDGLVAGDARILP